MHSVEQTAQPDAAADPLIQAAIVAQRYDSSWQALEQPLHWRDPGTHTHRCTGAARSSTVSKCAGIAYVTICDRRGRDSKPCWMKRDSTRGLEPETTTPERYTLLPSRDSPKMTSPRPLSRDYSASLNSANGTPPQSSIELNCLSSSASIRTSPSEPASWSRRCITCLKRPYCGASSALTM
jgi:hypothetical protein